MKYLLIVFTLLLAASCTDTKINDQSGFEFDNAWYWVGTIEEGVSKKELVSHVNTFANPNQTSYFFYYPNTLDISIFETEAWSIEKMAATFNDNPPLYGFYKMPNDSVVYEDGIWLMEQMVKDSR